MSESTGTTPLPDGWTEVRLDELTGVDGLFTDGRGADTTTGRPPTATSSGPATMCAYCSLEIWELEDSSSSRSAGFLRR